MTRYVDFVSVVFCRKLSVCFPLVLQTVHLEVQANLSKKMLLVFKQTCTTVMFGWTIANVKPPIYI